MQIEGPRGKVVNDRLGRRHIEVFHVDGEVLVVRQLDLVSAQAASECVVGRGVPDDDKVRVAFHAVVHIGRRARRDKVDRREALAQAPAAGVARGVDGSDRPRIRTCPEVFDREPAVFRGPFPHNVAASGGDEVFIPGHAAARVACGGPAQFHGIPVDRRFAAGGTAGRRIVVQARRGFAPGSDIVRVVFGVHAEIQRRFRQGDRGVLCPRHRLAGDQFRERGVGRDFHMVLHDAVSAEVVARFVPGKDAPVERQAGHLLRRDRIVQKTLFPPVFVLRLELDEVPLLQVHRERFALVVQLHGEFVGLEREVAGHQDADLVQVRLIDPAQRDSVPRRRLVAVDGQRVVREGRAIVHIDGRLAAFRNPDLVRRQYLVHMNGIDARAEADFTGDGSFSVQRDGVVAAPAEDIQETGLAGCCQRVVSIAQIHGIPEHDRSKVQRVVSGTDGQRLGKLRIAGYSQRVVSVTEINRPIEGCYAAEYQSILT